MEVGGDKFRSQKSKVDQIKDNIVLINEQIIKSQVEKSNTEKDIIRFKKNRTLHDSFMISQYMNRLHPREFCI